MPSKTKCGTTILLAGTIFLCFSCGRQKTAWKGTIEEVDGVTVIKNPKTPLYGEDVLELTEELSIGEAEGREENMFVRLGPSFSNLQVDKDGNIYVMDSGAAGIKVFDSDGGYLYKIGKKGQGPGEFQNPRGFCLTPQSEILANDMGSRQLKFFSLDGNFIKQISTANFWVFINAKVDRKGEILAGHGLIGEEGRIYQLVKKFSQELEEKFQVASIETARFPEFNPFFPRLYWDLTQTDHIAWGFPRKYEINVLDGEGNPVRRILKDYDPVLISNQEKEKWLHDNYGDQGPSPDVNIVWDKYHNAYEDLKVDDEGRIYAKTYEKPPYGQGRYFDVFDAEGRYIAKLPLNIQPRLWHKNKLYTIEEDENGYQIVKRYGVVWKI